MIRRTQGTNVGHDIADRAIGKLRLRGHSRISEGRAALLDDGKNMSVRELVHVRSIGMIARLGIQSGSSRTIAFATGAVTWATRFEISRFAARNRSWGHIDSEVRSVSRRGCRTAGNRGLVFVQFIAGTAAGNNRKCENSKSAKEKRFHDASKHRARGDYFHYFVNFANG